MSVILVTGATGQAGVEVCVELAKRADVEVRAGVHSPGKEDLLPPGVTPVPFDTEDPSTVEAALQGVDKLFLLTAGGPVGPLSTRVIVDAVRKSDVQRIVKLSSIDPEVEPQAPTDLWALETEAMVRETALPFTFLRPTFFFQNFSRGYWVPMMMQRTLALPFGDGRTGWLDSRDLALAAVKALVEDGHEGKTYTLTGPVTINLHEIASVFTEVTGQTVTYIPLSDQQWIDGMAVAGAPEDMARAMLALVAKTRDGLSDRVTDELGRLIGRPPRTIEEFAADHREELTALVTPQST